MPSRTAPIKDAPSRGFTEVEANAVLEEFREFRRYVNDAINVLLVKEGVLLGLGLLVVSIVLQNGYLHAINAGPLWKGTWVASSIGLILFSTTILLRGYFGSKYTVGWNPAYLLEELLRKDGQESVFGFLSGNANDGIKSMYNAMKSKSVNFNTALVFFIVGFILLLMYGVLYG